MRTVRCITPACEFVGVSRDVPDVLVARGVVQRADLFCAGCKAQMPEGSPAAKREKAVRRAPERR